MKILWLQSLRVSVFAWNHIPNGIRFFQPACCNRSTSPDNPLQPFRRLVVINSHFESAFFHVICGSISSVKEDWTRTLPVMDLVEVIHTSGNRRSRPCHCPCSEIGWKRSVVNSWWKSFRLRSRMALTCRWAAADWDRPWTMSVMACWVFQILNVERVPIGRMAASVIVVAGSSRTCSSTGLPQRMNRNAWEILRRASVTATTGRWSSYSWATKGRPSSSWI